MLTGFNGMQAALGLLPASTGSPSIGLGTGVAPPPPPPPMMHPSEAAIAATQHQQAMMQQTMAAAQMTRFAPPPSAPMPAMSAMSSYGGFGGGGGGGGGGYAPMAMGHRGFGGGGGMPFGPGMHMPSIFNPFAPTMPSPHFSTPGMYGLQMMHARQAQSIGAISGAAEFGMGLAGSSIGGAIGSAFGPLGTMAGGWLGGKIGGGLANMSIGPSVHDVAQGRMIQRMTAPYMATGAYLDPNSGQGLSRTAGLQVATGIRHLSRDADFERTGFNTADANRIMSGAAHQGLLVGAQSPDQIVSRVKEVSKTVKMLMQITGDPDVQSALASLGQMRNLGFMGLPAQAGAVANRTSFARMAGVSQGAMNEMGMAGAMAAQSFGLAGSTGFSAAMGGGAMANIASSSGALNDLQMARAGGRAGVAQINTQAALAAMSNPVYMAAALSRDKKGQLTLDQDAFRRAQGMSTTEVANEAANRMRTLGVKGIEDLYPKMGELKDQLAQKMNPLEMHLAAIQQARGLMKTGAASNMSAAFMAMGMDETSARTMGREAEDPRFYSGMQQQLRAQRRDAMDRDRGEREQFRTQGLGTRVSRRIRNSIGRFGDALASPIRGLIEGQERWSEDQDAFEHGERIQRFSGAEIAQDDSERALMQRAAGNNSLMGLMNSGGTVSRGQQMVRGFRLMSSDVGLDAAFGGRGGLAGMGNRYRGVVRGYADAASYDESKAVDTAKRLQAVGTASGKKNFNAGASLVGITARVTQAALKKKAGTFLGADPITMDDFKAAVVAELGPEAGEKAWADPKLRQSIVTDAISSVKASGNKDAIESITKGVERGTEMEGFDLSKDGSGADVVIDKLKRSTGLKQDFSFEGGLGRGGDVSDKTMEHIKDIAAHNDTATIALATAQAVLAEEDNPLNKGQQHRKAAAQAYIAKLSGSLGTEGFAKARSKASALQSGAMGDKATSAAMTRLLDVGSGADLDKRVEQVKDLAGVQLLKGAQTAGVAALSKIGGFEIGDSMTTDEALGRVTDDAIDRDKSLSPAQKKTLKDAKKGDPKAIEKVRTMFAPGAAEQVTGGVGGAATDEVDRLLGEVQSRKEEAEQAGDSSGGLTAASGELFANSVKIFADAVEQLKGSSEKNVLSLANPWSIIRGGS